MIKPYFWAISKCVDDFIFVFSNFTNQFYKFRLLKSQWILFVRYGVIFCVFQ